MPTSKAISIYFLLSFLSTVIHSQTVGKKIKEIKSAEVTQVSVDRLGNFFIVSKNNIIKKFDPQGKLMATLKGRRSTLIEPWYHPAISIYDQKKQSYNVYGRNFENGKELAVDPAWAIEPSLVCPSNDNKIWLFDRADVSIKKVNQLTHEILVEFNLDSTKWNARPDFTYLREYQNMIFLLDRNSGIFIFNNIGTQINKIEKKGLRNINFFGEELYYLEGNSITLFDLYTTEYRAIQIEGENKFCLVTDERIILVNDKNVILVYKFNP